jgi:hypothetical protein
MPETGGLYCQRCCPCATRTTLLERVMAAIDAQMEREMERKEEKA